MVTSIYIFRHCESEGNISETFQGHTDGNITPKGVLQLDALAERCKDIHFDIIYSSPLTRAKKTAQAVNRYHSLPIIEKDDLMELNGGEMEGHTWDEISVLFPDAHTLWGSDLANFSSPNGESIVQVYYRVKGAIDSIVHENKGKQIAVVSHGCAIFLMCAYLSGYSESELSRCNFWCENTSVTRIDFDEDLKPSIVFFNDFSHLEQNPDTAPHKMRWRDGLNKPLSIK